MTESVEIKFDLHPAQLEVFQAPERFVVLVAGRRFGKSHLAVVRAICSATSPDNVRKLPVWIVAPTHPQAKQIYWQTLLNMAAPLIASTNINEGLVKLHLGVTIGIKGSDRPETLRGTGLFDLILDEYADMKVEVWESILRPALADVRGRCLFIGTPKGRNHFHQLYVEAMEDQTGDWAAFRYHSTSNPFLPAGEIEAARRTMTGTMFRQEFEASFETGGAGVIKREWMRYEDEEPEACKKDQHAEWLLAADLAGFEEVKNATTSRLKRLDQSVLALVKIYGDDNWWVQDLSIGRWGTKETAKRIVDMLADEKKPVSVFGMEKGALYNAVMPYVIDEANSRKPPVRVAAQPLSHHNQSKIERVTWAVAGRLEHGRIIFRTAGWNSEAEDQITNFPSKLVHDDVPDALAFVAQIAEGRRLASFDSEHESYWSPMDRDVGV